MFTWLRNKEKDIASTAIAMFVGSGLLLFCQTCFAISNDTYSIDISQNKTEYSCHTADNETDKLVEHYNSDDDHCLGICDCDEITASLNSIEKTGYLDKFHKKVSIDSVVASISFKYREISSSTYQISGPPERAILLPLQRFTVFLI
ncbi:MAG: hypothetical protein IH836_01885 [Proteobacteria bacterium]|nr:hypothetical protein [Pseudomonadota bacterium]